ncbi:MULTISPECIES: helix-turn-helix transcriptional regulator [unclassified Ruegeria]|uniref:helix-turn-helix domain-containing protein n=1 Tax=unclassified Ruegeria TaxID=2625375 RepID=UPI0014887654|nr:helix-turn-helix transcriptional regulator [Ruegeria sp. HKCCD8929]
MSDDNDWYGPDAATFGDRVAGAREAAGMSQSEMARRLGVKKSTVAAWEQDLSEPRANRLSMMAGMLNVSIMWLLTGEGEGMDAPADIDEGDADLAAMAAELRAIRGEMRTTAERAARLEKRLRQLVGADH